MRIVQFANFYAPRSGGLRTFLDEVGRRYTELGHDRVLVVPSDRDRDVNSHAGRRVEIRSPVLPGSGGYRLLVSERRLRHLLDELRPDVLEVSDKILLHWLVPWARARGIPLLPVSHERTDGALRAALPRWFPSDTVAAAVTDRIGRLVDHVVVPSHFAATEFTGIPGLDTHVVPLGVDLDVFRPAPGRPARTALPARIGLVSRLSREKRPQDALAALCVLLRRRVPAGLVVLGDGPLRARLERDNRDLPVRFLGHLPDRRSVAHLLRTVDVVIAPGPIETFGLAALEALACGTPVVVPSTGAVAELVAGSGCGVVTDGTPDGLATGVHQILDRPPTDRRAAARARAEDFPWSATVARMLDAHAANGAPLARTTGVDR